MNVVSRGIKNAFRSPLRSGATILMLAISIGLVLSMLVARSSINTKIEEVKSSTGTSITISPAGMMGMSGNGNALTADNLATIKSTEHIESTTASLTDQLGTDETNLTSSQELGNLGARQQRFDSSNSSSSQNETSSETKTPPEGSGGPAMGRITVIGTSSPDSVSTDGGSLNISSGETIDGNSSDLVALVGTSLAEKNSLSVGDTFTIYSNTVTVKGIYETGNTFQDSNIIVPLTTLQNLTDQSGAISSVTAKVDSSDNVDTTVEALKSSLGDSIDITSEAEMIANSVESLSSIASLALAGVIGAAVAGAVIVLLSMIIIVRERRREIGVIKAIGGTDKKVILQFITEALSLTIVSAIIGLVFGVLVSGPMTTSLTETSSTSKVSSDKSSAPGGSSSSDKPSNSGSEKMGEIMERGAQQLGNNFTQVTSSVTPEVFVIAIGITFLIAIIGSAVPAWIIAKVRPSEVLKAE